METVCFARIEFHHHLSRARGDVFIEGRARRAARIHQVQISNFLSLTHTHAAQLEN